MLIKGPGSFKKNFKIGGNVDKLKAYRLIPLTPPLFFHFTLPLKSRVFGEFGSCAAEKKLLKNHCE
jgi:hypothetical protein